MLPHLVGWAYLIDQSLHRYHDEVQIAVDKLYFENPEFGFYFLQLASGRLLEAVARAEEMLGAENVR